MKKLYIQLKGGLGNQLYIVATGLTLAKSLGTKLVVDSSFFNSYKLHDVTVTKFLKDITIRNISFKIKNYNFFSLRKIFFNKIKESKIGYDQVVINKIKNKKSLFDFYLIGYFQSLNYFKSSLNQLKKEIRKNILNELPELKSKKVKEVLENSMAIHIRRKDKISKVNKKIYGFISRDEIIRIVKSLYKKNEYKYLLLLGDDTEFNNELQKELSSKFNAITSTSININSSIVTDFYYLMNCKGLILNNSSFGLWAGYLSNSKNIYYPDPIFPEPLHDNIKSLSKRDIILKKWQAYNLVYDD